MVQYNSVFIMNKRNCIYQPAMAKILFVLAFFFICQNAQAFEMNSGNKNDFSNDLINNFASETNAEEFRSLRKRDTTIPVEDDNKDRDDGPEEIPKGLPRPIMHRWFPEHDAPPQDSDAPATETSLSQATLDPAIVLDNNKSAPENVSQIEAFLQNYFVIDFEDGVQDELQEEDEGEKLDPSRKPQRVKRSTQSIMQLRKQQKEIMKRRKRILAEQNRIRATANRANRAPTRSTYRRQRTRQNFRPSSTRKPTSKPSRTKKPTRQSSSSAKPTKQRTTKPTSKPTPTRSRNETSTPFNSQARPNATISYKVPATTTGSSKNKTTEAPKSKHTKPTAPSSKSDKSKSKTQKRKRQNGTQKKSKSNTTKNNNYRAPTQRSGISKTQGGKHHKTTAPTKRKGSQNRNNLSKPKSNLKSSKTLTVVKPVMYNGQKTTKTITRPVSRQYDVSQNRNNRPITFSKWGQWLQCKAKGCGTTGRQMRTRTCYGDNFTQADYDICNYNSLVSYRQCRSAPCPTTRAPKTTTTPDSSRISRWSEWSKCSVTCGTSGTQTRTRLCYEISQDNSEEMLPTTCEGKSRESRPCQYSVSCPMWDSWSDWSSCSKTCGVDGVSFRERKCIVERYVTFAAKPRGMQGPNRRRQFDSGAAMPNLREPTVTNKNTAVKVSKPKQFSRFKDGSGLLLLNDEGTEVFIVDAPYQRDEESPNFHERQPVKELVNPQLCAEIEGHSEEERRCIMERCPAEWGKWNDWSDCSTTCGPGISKRERTCKGGSDSTQCDGRKYTYRRCYVPPCWTEWSEFSKCSISCGENPGSRRRTRLCKGTSVVIPEYTSCDGSSTQTEQCEARLCPSSMRVWSEWSEYDQCSVSCNGGYRRRTRECLAVRCSGPAEDFGACNRQECPSWTKWSMFSCCSVTCGQGTRKRTRKCANGNIGMKGCTGKTTDTGPCYKAPCGQVGKSSVFDNMKCGIGSVAKLKKVAFLRIFGGTRAAAHSWPWQVSWQHRQSLTSRWDHFCGATLLHARWVITASHCTEESEYFVDHKNPGAEWSVVVGMVKLYEDGDRYFVERIFIHPKYEYKSVTKNDIALLKLRETVKTTKDVMPACMPKMTAPVPGEECYISGWGYTSSSPSAPLSLSLREAAVPIMQFSRCRTLGDYYRYFLNSKMHMCAGNPVTASADSCTGDSGGPLVCAKNKRWYLAAVTSFGFADCGTPGHVGIYAPMTTYETWVRNIIESNTYEKC